MPLVALWEHFKIKKMNILILSTVDPSEHLVEAIEEKGHTWERFHPAEIYIYTSEKVNGYDRVYDGWSELEQPVRLNLKNYDAVITRLSGERLSSFCNILRHLNENLGIYSPQTADGLLTATDKLKTIQDCSVAGIRVPRTVYAHSPAHVEFLIKKIGGLPAVAKTIRGSQGNGVFLLNDVEQTNTSLQAIYKLNVDLILQEYIEADKKDIRAIVVGDKVIAAIQRQGSEDFRANLSQAGGMGQAITLSDADEQFCVDAAKAVGLEFAGVDIMKRKGDNTTYLIEVNGNMGTKSIGITGVNWFKNLVEHIEEETGSVPKSKAVNAIHNKATNEKPKGTYTTVFDVIGRAIKNVDKR
jgi:ribosomal protein S6--L-glutamate ligase